MTGAIVDFLEARGVTSYAVRREPSSITLSLPDEPETAVEHHVEGLRNRLQAVAVKSRAGAQSDLVSRDPRDQHAIIVSIYPIAGERPPRDLLVQRLQSEEDALRGRGIESLVLFGSAATRKAFPHDVDLLARFRHDARLSAFDLAEIQLYLEQRLGRRVDLSDERTISTEFRTAVDKTGIRIFGS